MDPQTHKKDTHKRPCPTPDSKQDPADVRQKRYCYTTGQTLKMEFLNKSTVHIKNRDKVEEIVSQLIKGGASKLQVISDFDFTMSRFHKNGENCFSTYDVLKRSSLVTEDYKNKANCLFKRYRLFELDPTLTKAEKTPIMLEWLTKIIEIMPTSGITKNILPKIVATSNLFFRDGCDVLCETLNKHNVPLLVFSAGIGDVLQEKLQASNLLYPNIKIVANFLKFNEKDDLTGIKGSPIHSCNKNQNAITDDSYFHLLESRNNIILIGDSLGDVDMAEGAKNVNVILKIGFLNLKIEDFLPTYLDNFDIVLTDDQTMDVVVGLLQSIF